MVGNIIYVVERLICAHAVTLGPTSTIISKFILKLFFLLISPKQREACCPSHHGDTGICCQSLALCSCRITGAFDNKS